MTGNFKYALPLSGGGEAVVPIHIDGTAFKRPDGSYWQWRGVTDFLLYARWLRGEDISPILEDRLSVGANLVRVLGMVDSFANFYPQEYGDTYYDRLPEFADYLASRGLYLEFVVFADALIVMPSSMDRARHMTRVCEAMAHKPNVFIEVANEPGHVNQIGPSEAQSLGEGRSLLVASGNYTLTDGQPSAPRCDYVTIHVERDDEWPRKNRSLAENRDGFSWSDGTAFEGYHCPCLDDEGMGADDVNQPGKRSNVPEDFRFAGACAAMMGAGGTFHSTNGIVSQVWTEIQRACAKAYFEGLRYVPVECQFSPYQRGGAGGGAGIGDMPVEHHDLDEQAEPRALRTYAKFDADGNELALAIRPTVPVLVPRDGWQLIDQPWPGIGTLTR